MGIFQEVEQFLQAHRLCGQLTWDAAQPTPKGYRVKVACQCGAAYDRWVTLAEAEYDLLRSGLLAFPN